LLHAGSLVRGTRSLCDLLKLVGSARYENQVRAPLDGKGVHVVDASHKVNLKHNAGTFANKMAVAYVMRERCQPLLLIGEYAQKARTAPIPELAPVIRTILPSNLDALKMDMTGQGTTIDERKEGSGMIRRCSKG
jgi:hypothetical protein